MNKNKRKRIKKKISIGKALDKRLKKICLMIYLMISQIHRVSDVILLI